MTQVQAASLNLPKVPRPVTGVASRRAWAELPVQFWWKSALVIMIIAAIVGIDAARRTLRERWLMNRGLAVEAEIVEVRGTSRQGFAVARDDEVAAKLRWTMPDGQEVTVDTVLPLGRGYVKVGENLPIHVDPHDPHNWAETSEVQPWWRVLATPLLMMVPIALILFAIALFRRRRVLKVWRGGWESDGVVVETRNISTAPRSRIVRYTMATGPDKRVFEMLYPMKAGVPRPGETFRLLALRDQPDRALAAALYAEPTTQG